MNDVAVLAFADDLTGALEVGAKFSGAGMQSSVTLGELPGAGAPVLVIDTETRHVTAEEAYREVRAVAESARLANPVLVYKKTDSTLRGNIGSELAALVEVFGGPVTYAPAYPELGRTVKNGCLYVHGIPVSETAFAHDALNPIRDSYIPRLLAGFLPAEAVRVVDADCTEDLRVAAEMLLASGGVRVAAGPAAFAACLAERIDLPRAPAEKLPAVRKCLVVNGSLHEVSLGQVRHAEELGWPVAPPDRVVDRIGSSGWAILRTDDAAGEGPQRARAVGRIVREVLNRTELDALIVFGGDTAFGIVEAVAKPPLFPVREMMPGVPLSRLGRLCLITKAGGFGGVDVLPELRILLSKER